MNLNWTPQQEAIFRWVQNPEGSRIAIAVAGSGKTTTLVRCASLIPPNCQSTFVAFNKHIADELSNRLPETVRSMTLNALGYRAWLKFCHTEKPRLDTQKNWHLMDEFYPSVARQYGSIVNKLVGLAKTVGLVPESAVNIVPITIVEDTPENWHAVIDRFGVELEGWMDQDAVLNMARKVLAEGIVRGTEEIDFNDQLYLPVINDVSFLRNDWLFVDEAQDLNALQLIMLRKSLKDDGHMLAVGDPKQSIYAFRGAACDAIEQLKCEFHATEMPLTVSFRCPKKVVAEARQVFIDLGDTDNLIEHAPDAEDGEVLTQDNWDSTTVNMPRTLVLCRNNKPLAEVLFKLRRDGVPAFLKGKDALSGVIAIAKKMHAVSLEDLNEKLGAYQQKEETKLQKANSMMKLADFHDRCETLRVFMDNSTDLRDLGKKLESAADEKKGEYVTLSTIHKAKGLEFDHVFIVDQSLMPSFYARTEDQIQQEHNLRYVAVTRAKKTLVYVESKEMR